jgi:hypothetical protein
LHGVADEGVPFRDIAAVIGRHLNVPEVSISPEQANHFGFLSLFASLDNPTSNTLTQKVLDWHPERPGLIQDLDEGHYFTA